MQGAIKPALVLEGGGFRGIYTGGVLDVLLENGLGDAFSVTWGVSAGATNASTFKARQIGRTCRVFLAFRDDPRFMSFQSLARTGSIAGNDFVYGDVMYKLDPFDIEAFHANPMRMMAVVTDATFGTPAYFEIAQLPEDTIKVVASTSLPVVSETIEIDGGRYLDGGTADSVPIEVALGETKGVGVPDDIPIPEKALVVLTQHRGYKKGPYSLMALARKRYAGYPYLIEAIETRAERYNAQRQHIWELEEQGRVMVLAPKDPVELSLTETSGAKLLDLYIRARKETTELLPKIRAFLDA